uniref:Uncharacterized protein n=1 Tax=Panagrolaimus davidi TaxID=227884 RepID=A0A914R8Z8_9BILA
MGSEFDTNYFVVPSNLYEFIEKPFGGKVLIVNESNMQQYRKYRSETETKFYCSGCYFKHGFKVYAYFIGGIVKAPKLHRCEFLLTSNREAKIKAKIENGIYAAIGNVQQASISSKSGVITLPPIDIFSSSYSEINQQPHRVIDTIFIDDDDDEIHSDLQKNTPPAKNITPENLVSEFRSVGPDLYERAYNTRGKKYRLIVFEDEEKIQVRQYSANSNNRWYCWGCFKKAKKNIRARFKDENFIVPKKHFCDPFSYEEIKNEQKEIIQKFNINEENESGSDENSVNDEQQHLFVEPLQNSIRKRLRSRTPTAPVYCEPPNIDKQLIPADRYVFGVGTWNQANWKIFVFDENDKSHGKEFTKNQSNSFYCRGCFALDKTKRRNATLKEKGLLIPLNHICESKLYADFQKEQEEIKRKYGSSPAKIICRRPRNYYQNQNVPASDIPGSSKTPTLYSNVPTRSPPFSSPIRQRQQTPADPFWRSQTPETPFIQGVATERKARRSYRINTAPTPPKKLRSKSIERDNHSDPNDERLSFAPLQRTKSIDNLCYNRKSYLWNIGKNGTQAFGNTSTTSSSNISTPINLPSSSKPRILYSAKIPAPSSFVSSPSSPFSTSSSQSSPLSAMANLARKVMTNKTPTRTLKDLILSPTPSSTSSTTPSDLTTTINCYKPSSFFLKKSCEKLEIEVYNEEYNIFWFDFKKVSQNSIPENIYETFEEIYHGFECISLYFTGNEENAAFIREKINQHFYYQNSENPISREKEGETLFSKSIKDLHFQTISKWFDCRIGIFVENNWKRFGNWTETDSDIPTMLLEMKENGKYSIIQSLK